MKMKWIRWLTDRCIIPLFLTKKSKKKKKDVCYWKSTPYQTHKKRNWNGQRIKWIFYLASLVFIIFLILFLIGLALAQEGKITFLVLTVNPEADIVMGGVILYEDMKIGFWCMDKFGNMYLFFDNEIQVKRFGGNL